MRWLPKDVAFLLSSFQFVDENIKRRIRSLAGFLSIAGLLDLGGVFLIGLVGSVTISSIQSSKPDDSVTAVLNLFQISGFPSQIQVILISVLSLILLLIKSVYSSLLQKKIFEALANAGVQISTRLVKDFLLSPITVLRKKTEKESLFAITSSVEELTLRVIGGGISILSDVVLLVFLGTFLFFTSPIMTIVTAMMFTAFFLVTNSTINKRARVVGGHISRTTVNSNELISTAYHAFRDISTSLRFRKIISEVEKSRLESAKYQSVSSFLPYISKYLMESTVLITAFLISMLSFVGSEAIVAATKIGIFSIASTRLAPAVLRIQHSLFGIKMGLEPARRSLNFLTGLSPLSDIHVADNRQESLNVSISKCSFKHEDGVNLVIDDVTLEIVFPSRIAIVGPSGAGKSTLAELILGLLQPTSGHVLIGDMNASLARLSGAAKISYVPQDPYILNDSILNNLTLGLVEINLTYEEIWKKLELVKLQKLRINSGNNLNASIGETGIKLSGGERQKLALARALLISPDILVLDEATSALDPQSEYEINELIKNISKTCIVITVAHRLTSISDYEKIIYMSQGKIKGTGSFKELRSKVEDFDLQAKRMGL